MNNNNYTDVNGIAEYLKVSRVTIYNMINDKSIPYVKVRGRFRFKKGDVDKAMKGQ